MTGAVVSDVLQGHVLPRDWARPAAQNPAATEPDFCKEEGMMTAAPVPNTPSVALPPIYSAGQVHFLHGLITRNRAVDIIEAVRLLKTPSPSTLPPGLAPPSRLSPISMGMTVIGKTAPNRRILSRQPDSCCCCPKSLETTPLLRPFVPLGGAASKQNGIRKAVTWKSKPFLMAPSSITTRARTRSTKALWTQTSTG